MKNAIEENSYLEVVDTQLRDGFPAETRRAYERLVAKGYTREYARLLIGNLLARDVYTSLKSNQKWDIDGYVSALRRLPEQE